MKKLVLLLTLILGIQSSICSDNTNLNYSSNASESNNKFRVIDTKKTNTLNNKIDIIDINNNVAKVFWFFCGLRDAVVSGFSTDVCSTIR